jgi:parvulin-like peptidyl-prolyl isomerase
MPTPTPNIIAPDKLGTQYADWLKLLAGAGVDETSYRQIMRSLLLQDKLQEAISKEVPTTAEQAHARHILVKTEDEAKKVVERLKAGEDFAKLAAELSEDTGSKNEGGDLGFVPHKRFVAPIDEAIFTLALHQVSDPIKTDFGWHVVEVLERDTRELSPSDYNLNQRLAYNDWLTTARTAATVEDYWSKDKVPEESPVQPNQ